ncbi:hypothetical protein PHYBLDRAFT_71900 [Phycomyces blakesleeanus NRRL 1555(-)]|uniref:Transmembrane protein n=1 Tax=Phycomyces blakesleeanus (strain ATCC 8743b / DSM 1359 / FGSC 10004 / NBRC 33097 / NRRL 1555) TaxID=763407 RepID=A0A167JTF0_PHYB8|nr:hypothetical protein PHYBLDRAFT_71900 [Phycomyces blakesleeanus NRRL 1555(-)]OAD66670.1 hypothetical protein PHYBLDRAFT_71900 [Phycomyces blakesleeanus NRRL 1555(-)]|eukprot:XP_018284710.1 hypothetical protein PHYBLDRAFT_71900 [Phycomyces blakesleeanus NRRL 1555(-)]
MEQPNDHNNNVCKIVQLNSIGQQKVLYIFGFSDLLILWGNTVFVQICFWLLVLCVLCVLCGLVCLECFGSDLPYQYKVFSLTFYVLQQKHNQMAKKKVLNIYFFNYTPNGFYIDISVSVNFRIR